MTSTVPKEYLELVIVCVLLVWIASSIRAVIYADYMGVQIVTPVFIIIVAALFAPWKNGRRS